MPQKRRNCEDIGLSSVSPVTLSDPPDGRSMGKEERKLLVLELLGKSDLALPPAVIFRNLKMRGATFERRTLTNYLDELEEEGYIEKVPETSGYYRITDEGRRYLLTNE